MNDLERILRRGKVEIENVIVTVGYTPFDPELPGQTAIQAPAVTVKWHANGDRRRASQSDVYRRFRPKDRITFWFYNEIFGSEYYETTKPTLVEALADIEAHTRPGYNGLDDLVATNEVFKEGVAVVEALMRCA